MNWIIVVVGVIGIIIGLGLTYFVTSLIVGQNIAQRNLQNFLPLGIIVGTVTVFLSYYSSNTNFVFPSLQILSIIFVVSYFIIWFWRKRQTGSLLLNIGLTRGNWLILLTGVAFTLLAIGQTYILMTQTTETFSEGNHILLSPIIINSVLAIFFLVSGLSPLEFREKAICFMSSIIKWDEIRNYKWEGKQGNILTIFLKKRLFGFPNYRTLPISTSDKAAVEGILRQCLPQELVS